MRLRYLAPWMVLALCPCPGLLARDGATAPATETTWMTVQLGGQRIGHLRIDRRRDGDVVTTTQDLRIELQRNGQATPMAVLTRSVESTQGQPLGFYMRSTLSRTDNTVDGSRQPDGRYLVNASVGGLSQRAVVAWPSGALLSDGQRQAMAEAVAQPRRYLLRVFDPASLGATVAELEVLGRERVNLPDGSETLTHLREQVQTPRGIQRMELWVNARGETRKSSLAMFGRELDLLACSQACALAPPQTVDLLRASLIDAPHSLPTAMRQGVLRYVIHTDDAAAQPVVSTDEQRVTALGHGDWQVDIGNALPGGQAPPVPADAQANAWLQSDDPAIRQLAARAADGATDPAQVMERLRAFTHGYIQPQARDVGVTSALEALRTRRGDCKQYAVLLAALARAQHIPARVVSGVVYADRYGNSARVFVPHAWVQAWVQGRWQSYDAALGQFDSTHIALDSGDGDPWRAANLSGVLGQLHIAQVGPAPVTAPAALAGTVASSD